MEIVDDTIHVVVKTCQDHFRSRNPNQHNQSLSLRKTTSNGLFKDAGFDNKIQEIAYRMVSALDFTGLIVNGC